MFCSSLIIWLQLEKLREPDNNQPFDNQIEGLFLFIINYYPEKEGFLKIM